ncbi:hypothetical protein [Anaerofustis butyriciformans]|uniref:hypothetical protein n=1 Tax=Anaerofustis butyriciformans TaxID=3108533 RepID=UPI002E325CEE|nr:hypothetical protein [Anaerofustis sp. HA2171]
MITEKKKEKKVDIQDIKFSYLIENINDLSIKEINEIQEDFCIDENVVENIIEEERER